MPRGRIRISEVLNALDNSILEETDTAENGDGRSLRSIVNECMWKRINRFIIDFAENKTLAEFIRECREKLPGEWDMYVI